MLLDVVSPVCDGFGLPVVVMAALPDIVVAPVQLEVGPAEVIMELLERVYVVQSIPVMRLNPFPIG